MKYKTFSLTKGIKLPKLSAGSDNKSISELEDPDIFYVSMKEHKGKEATVVVSVGDKVKRGTIIGKSNQINIFSPVSGVVKDIVMRPSAMGGLSRHVVIENDRDDAVEKFGKIGSYNQVGILKRIFEAGIVDNGVPLFKKLVPDKNKTIKTLLVNGCIDEPYISNNFSIIANFGEQVIEGAKILCAAMELDKTIFALNKSVINSCENFPSQIVDYIAKNEKSKNQVKFSVEAFADVYPIGDEYELLTALLGKRPEACKDACSLGYLVVSLPTLLAVYRAVVLGAQDCIRLITIVGCDKEGNRNCWIKSGTTFEYIAKHLVSSQRIGSLVKVIAGGPMRGIAVSDLSVSVTRSMNAIMFLTADDIFVQEEHECINCGMCVKVCPRNLLPNRIDECCKVGDLVSASKFGAECCSECGCCAFVCPAKRYLVQRIGNAKRQILAKGIDKWN